MGIVLKTNINTLLKKYEGNVAKVAEQRAIAKLHMVGEKFIVAAREVKSYKNQTGNLRSSIGYAVAINGSIVDIRFELTENGEDGLKEGQKLARKLARENSKGYVLICMAGMEYAINVSEHGYDVIDSGEHAARVSWRKLFKQ